MKDAQSRKFALAAVNRGETFGTKLRRLARSAQVQGNCWDTRRGYMRAIRPWQPSTTYAAFQLAVNGGNVYICVVGGTSAASGGPTTTGSASTTDGTIQWTFWGPNYVTADAYTTLTAWVASTAYTLGQQVTNGGNVYACVQAGTSAGSGGPTGTSNAITDNTAKWTYMGVYVAPAYPAISPTVTTSASPIAGLNYYRPAIAQIMSAQRASPLFTGSGYAVGDTVTLATGNGTATTSTVLRITSVNNSHVFTVSGVTTAPVAGDTYTNNGVTFTVVSTSIAAGSGTITGYSAGTPAASGSLTRATGSGDATIAFSAVTNATGVPSGCSVATAGQYTTLQSNNTYWSQGSTSGAGTGATFSVGFNAPGWCNIYGAYMGSAASLNARPFTFTPAPQAAPVAQDWSMEFYTDSANVQFNNLPVSALLVIDGVIYCPDVTTGITTNTYLLFNFDKCGGRKKRLFQIYVKNTGPFFPFVQVDGVATVWRPDRQDIITCAAFSDSIWAGSSYGPYMPGNSVCLRLGLELGWRNMWSFTQGGTGWLTGGAAPGVTTGTFQSRITQALLLNPDVWLFMGSTNDIGLGNVTSTVTAALRAIRNGGSTAPIIVLGLWPINSAGVATTEAQVQAGVTAFNDPLGKTFFIPIYNDPFLPWITGSWNNNPAPSGITNTGAQNATAYINNSDNIHPPDPGTEYLAKRIAQAVMSNVLPVLK